jgi:hypothetical protein
MSTRRSMLGAAYHRLERDAEGRALCRWCKKPVPPLRRTFCGGACVEQWQIRTNPGYARRKVEERDHGVCSACGFDTERIKRLAERLAKLSGPDSVIVPQSDDRVAKYLLVAIGHDGTLAFRIGYTPIRVVCNNTLSVAIHSKESTYVRLPHLSGVNAAIDKVTTAIAGVDARFEKTAEVFRALAAHKIRSTAELHAYVDAVYPPAKTASAKTLGEEVTPGAESFADLLAGSARIAETTTTTYAGQAPVLAEQGEVEDTRRRIHDEIEYLFTQGKGNALAGVAGTAWAAYNAVTDHLTWHRGGAKNQDSRLENLWLSNSGPVSRALPAAVDTFLAN